MSNEPMNVLSDLANRVPEGILIGGWGSLSMVETDLTHDIDFILASQDRTLVQELLDDYSETTQQNGGRKLRGLYLDTHVDAYLPYVSFLGDKLRLKVEALVPYATGEVFAGWKTLNPEAQFVTKLAAFTDRHTSKKGAKDAGELYAFIKQGLDPQLVATILSEASQLTRQELANTVVTTIGLLPRHIHPYRKADGQAVTRFQTAVANGFGYTIQDTNPAAPTMHGQYTQPPMSHPGPTM